MYKHLLIATDGGALASKAVSQGLALARELRARVTAVTVTEMWSVAEMATNAKLTGELGVEGFEANAKASAAGILGAVKAAAEAAHVQCETLHVADADPAQGILTAAKDHACDLIVMASHGRSGIDRLVLGSQAAKVMQASSVPVLVVR